MKKLIDTVKNHKSLKYGFAALSGILTALPMLVPQLFLLTWISLIPLLFALFISENRFWRSFRLFLVYGIFYFTIVYLWFLSLNAFDSPSFIYIKTGIWLGVALVQAVQFSLAGILYRLANGKGIFKVVTVPFIWILIEWFQELTIWGMPWGRLAVSQYLFLPGIQSASLLGSLFVSFIIVVVNSLAAYALTVTDNKKLFKGLVIASASVFVLNCGFGLIRTTVLASRSYEKVYVSAVQGNLPSAEKWENGGDTSFEVYLELSQEAADKGAKIILWPETAVPVHISQGDNYDRTYSNFANVNDVYLVVGSFFDEGEATYSSLILYSPDGTSNIDEPYRKRHLVPFGEFVPYREIVVKLLPFLADFRMLGADLTSADKTVVFESEYGNMNGLICFDSIFSQLARADVNAGSQLILIGTNDSYYSDSLNPRQHNGQAVLRAVENGKYVLRAANTGISSIITPYGALDKTSEMNERTTLCGYVSFVGGNTLFGFFGDGILFVAAAFLIFTAIYCRVKKQNKTENNQIDN